MDRRQCVEFRDSEIPLAGEWDYHQRFGATGADGRFQSPQDPHGQLGQK